MYGSMTVSWEEQGSLGLEVGEEIRFEMTRGRRQSEGLFVI